MHSSADPLADSSRLSALGGPATVACRVAPRRVDGDAELFRWLLDRLPVAAAAIGAVGGTRYEVGPIPEGFAIADPIGARARCRVAAHADGLLVVVARGELGFSVGPAVRGTGVIGIRYVEAGDGLAVDAAVRFRVDRAWIHRATTPFAGVLGRVLRARLDALMAEAGDLAARIRHDPEAVARALESAGRPGEAAALRGRGGA